LAIGKQVRLFLVDGSPTGILTAEIMNWTGRVVAGSRSELNDMLARGEANSPGVYFLLGEDPLNPEERLLYIGEADDVAQRLRQHNSASTGKDFWNRAIFLTSKDANLTKAHVRYLESRLIALANVAGRFTLTNGNYPPPVNLPEADISDMEYFISQAKIILPLLGLDAFREAPKPISSSTSDSDGSHASPMFEIQVPVEGGIARGQDVAGEFVVFQGSAVRSAWGNVEHSYKNLYDKLSADGTLAIIDGQKQFTKDYAFKSPSAAAGVVYGRTANGRTDWKVPATGQTYAEWQEQLAPPLVEVEA
jgi:hypothetical protein